MARKAKVTEKHRQVARALRRGATDRKALLDAGYGEASAKKGITHMQREVPALAEAIHDESMKQARELIAQQGRKLNKEELEQLVEAVLTRNALNGEGDKKGSSYAAKLIGSLRRVNVFEPDTAVGVLAMEIPAEWRDRYSLSDKEVVEINNSTAPALPPAPEPTGEPQKET